MACTQCLETGDNGVKGKIEVVKTLLHHGAKCPKGCTELNILMKACETSCVIVKILLHWFVRPTMFPLEVRKYNIRGEKAKKILMLLTTPKGKDGTTCLMCAGRKGNIKVMTYLIRTIGKKWDKYYLNPKYYSGNPDNLLTKLLIRHPTRSEFVKACYDKITDNRGNTAAMLLAKYYKKHSEKFHEFITEATKSPKQMYLFHLMPRIVPQFSDPNIIVAIFHDELLPQLQKQRGYHADVKLLSVLVNIAATLTMLTAIWHPIQTEKFGIREFCEDVDRAVEACMSCFSMHKRANVMKILQDGDSVHTNEQAAIICEASAFVNGPLALCIQHNLTELLGTVPISTHVDRVFKTSLRPIRRKYIHGWSDIFQVRSGCATLRYRPVFMFIMEGIAKFVYLVLVAIVPYYGCGLEGACVSTMNFTLVEMCIVVMTVAGTLYEIGEMCDRYGFWQHIADVWNKLDFIGLFCASMWLFCRLNHSHHNLGRGFLAWSAVPMSLGLLRFVSSVNFLGHSVNVIFAISSHLLEFVIVFVISVVGFGIAFHSLFPDLNEFKGIGSTSLTLFIVALGDHEFLKKDFENHPFEIVGLVMMVLYITFLSIIVLNFMVAKMGNTFGDVQQEARKQWSMFMARNVQACLLIREKNNPLCMLPPPLNVFTLLVWPWDALEWRKQNEKERLSICGSTSDLLLGLLCSPICALFEIYLVNREFCWLSNIHPQYAYCFLFFSILLLPLWWFIFWVLILRDVIVHTWNKRVRISNRNNHIIYDESKGPVRVDEKFTGGDLEMEIIEFALERGKGPFSRTANVYVQATYGNDVQQSDHRQCDHATVFLNHTFEFKLIENGKLKLQIFDYYYNGDTNGERAGDSVLFAESDEDDVKKWIANRRYEGYLTLYQPGHTRTVGAKVKLAVKIKYEKQQPKSHPHRLTRIGEIAKCKIRMHQLAQEASDRVKVRSTSMLDDVKELNVLSDMLALKNLSIRRVPGEGNCLFAAVSDQLFNTDSNHAAVRDFCVSHMRCQPDRFAIDKDEHETVDEYFHRMSQDKEWAGEPELQAIAEMTCRPIHIYLVDKKGKARQVPYIISYKKTDVKKTDNREPIVLIYINGNHYDSVKPSILATNANNEAMEKENLLKGNPGFNDEDDDDMSGDEHTETEEYGDPLFSEADRTRIFDFLLKSGTTKHP